MNPGVRSAQAAVSRQVRKTAGSRHREVLPPPQHGQQERPAVARYVIIIIQRAR